MVGKKRKKFTPITIENEKARSTRREVPDPGCEGLYLVVQPSGFKSWVCRYRFPKGGTPRKLTLGAWPGMQLVDARKLAADARVKLKDGVDPAAEKQQAKAEAVERDRDTVATRFEQYLEQHCKKQTREKTWEKTEGMFRKDVLPAWGARSVHDIKRKHVIDLVEDVAKARPVQANRLLMAVSRFYRWLMARDVVVASPVAGVAMPSKEKPRERVLSDTEIPRFWKACEAVPAPFGDVYRLLLLTGARRQEVAEMQWPEIDEQTQTWTLPEGRSKNHESRTTPLSRQAWDIIRRQPRAAGSPHVFGRRTAHSHMKAPLDAAMQPDAPWVIHDLRRTCASGLQAIGTDIAVTEAILGHTSGTFRGIVSVYQRHNYQREKRAALQMWANKVDALVKGEATGKVVALRKRRR
jgi:integrase